MGGWFIMAELEGAATAEVRRGVKSAAAAILDEVMCLRH